MAAALEAIFYAIARGVTRAVGEMLIALHQAEKEVPDEEAIRVRTRFRDAITRLRASESSDSRSQLPAPISGGSTSGDLGSPTKR